MSECVANCPRCGAKKITLDIDSAILRDIQYNWKGSFELHAVCRRCHKGSILIAAIRDYASQTINEDPSRLVRWKGAVNDVLDVEGYISLKDESATQPPEHLPPDIKAAFLEGATSLAVNCPNAAAAMFRMCIDLSTKKLLPDGEVEGLNRKTRRDLAPRLAWLFSHGLLSSDLQPLSACIREDGNDGAHDGTLQQPDAEDLLDFTGALLERLYTEPARLKIAEARRDARRKPQP